MHIVNKDGFSAAETPFAAEIENIIFNYAAQNDAAAINDVSFQVRKGECLLLTGLSGCGKTSILRLLNGLIPRYYEGALSGSVLIGRENIANLPIYEVSKKAATVFQNPKSQFFNLDTTSEILFFLENTGTPIDVMRERLGRIASFLHIEHLLDRNIFNLSGGEKQMIAIASALASDTDIILFDEPTSNLDVFYIERIALVLRKLKAAGKTLIISEHRLYFLKDIIDRALILKDGKIAHSLSAAEFAGLTEKKRKEFLLRPITLDGRVFARELPSAGDGVVQSAQRAQMLHIEQLFYRFPKEKNPVVAVENLSLGFGNITALVGKSGQGKSTFVHCLAGLTKPNKEAVYIGERKLSAAKRLALSYLVMQDVGYQLFTESVADEIALGKNKHNRALDTDRVLSALNLTQLKERHPLSLSGGQKQRVSIGAAVASGAQLLIFDEPTSGMDYFHMKETASLIKSVRAPDRLILIISHDFEFLSLVADELLLMENGKIVSQTAFTAAQVEKVFEQLRTDAGRNSSAQYGGIMVGSLPLQW
ncbi:ABC transporter ATP-binding protein [Treponema socranskii]|uniref:ABC transporter ATP-binding protein n=1 Tax=Treponema socranskii TaxID=53419 RepID=UPI0028E870B2|nr:ABC transporter ATP-binding protein [Treponema socranskii]